MGVYDACTHAFGMVMLRGYLECDAYGSAFFFQYCIGDKRKGEEGGMLHNHLYSSDKRSMW